MTHRVMSAGVYHGLMVGPPMLNRSKDKDQTKCDPLVPQVGGWAKGFVTTETKSRENSLYQGNTMAGPTGRHRAE